jgi:multidrug resistance efflux pump
MNPTMDDAKALNPVLQKRNGALSQHKMWQLDFRYVRILLIVGAIGCSLFYWHERFEHPMTDDAYIQADVIRVTAQVNGPLKKIEVADNQKIRQGQELLQIDPEPSMQELQDWTTKRDQAKATFLRAQHTLQLQGSDNAGVLAAKAALDNAQLNLSYTRVIAEKGGMVTNLNLPPGNYIKVGEPLFTMVTDDSWRAIAYFKETVLHKIRPGQKAKIELVAYPDHVFHGVVQGVGWGITQQDVVLSDSLPTVAPTVNWVRLPQRFPVRVDIIDPDPAFPLRMGQTVVVSIDTTN